MNRPLQMLTIGLAGVLLGAMLGVLSTGGDSPDRPEQPIRPVITDRTEGTPDTEPVQDDEVKGLKARVAILEAERDATRARASELASRVTELAGEREEIASERDALKADLAELQVAMLEATQRRGPGPGIRFGEFADLEALLEADWDKLGDSADKMIPLLVQAREAHERGEGLPDDVQERINRYNMDLIAHYMRIRENLPTNAAHNGEYTHPINLANMLDAQLRVAEMPLTDSQRAAIAAHGTVFESRWQASKAGYTDQTFRMEKLLDEAVHKEWFKRQMLSELTPEQRALVVPPEVDGLLYLDLYSPALLFVRSAAPVPEADRNALVDVMQVRLASLLSLDEQRMAAASHVFAQWFNQYPPRDVTGDTTPVHLDEILNAMRGQLAAMKELHSTFTDNDTERERIRKQVGVLLPRIQQG